MKCIVAVDDIFAICDNWWGRREISPGTIFEDEDETEEFSLLNHRGIIVCRFVESRAGVVHETFKTLSHLEILIAL